MDMKVLIFGDSYADPKGTPNFTWHKKLKNNYSVVNYAETGTGPQYSFELFYDLKIEKNNVIIFLLSDSHRINFHGGAIFKGELSHIVWDEKVKKSYCVFEKYSKNLLTNRHMRILDYHKKYKEHIDFFYLTQQKELSRINSKNILFLHNVSKKNDIKIMVFDIFKSTREDMTYLNDNKFHLFPNFLSEKSIGEIYEKEIDIFDRHSDKRFNHFSEINHQIFYEYVNNFIRDINKFPKFKQNFKHCEDVYESTKFIYE